MVVSKMCSLHDMFLMVHRRCIKCFLWFVVVLWSACLIECIMERLLYTMFLMVRGQVGASLARLMFLMVYNGFVACF